MKIDRMLGIITVLLQKDQVTAGELAARFEVCPRTIRRDVDAICLAGIPLITKKGGGGGISIAQGFKLDKSALTAEELQSILCGLQGIGSVTAASQVEQLLHKLSPEKSGADGIVIDLSSHYKNSLSEKIEQLRTAIREQKLVAFDYFSAKGEKRRLIEPYCVVFQWSSWYILGYCKEREDFRLFKLNRLWELQTQKEQFAPREIPPEKMAPEAYFADQISTAIRFAAAAKYLLIDAYGPGCYEELPDGSLYFSRGFTNKEHLFQWILGFGELAELLEPEEWRNELAAKIKNMSNKYE